MFGKGNKSKPIAATRVNGVDAGSLKGRGTSNDTAPMAAKSSMATPSGTLFTEKRAKGMSKGSAGPVKLTRS